MSGTGENAQVVSVSSPSAKRAVSVFDECDLSLTLSPTDLTFSSASLQEMIDSELALRITQDQEQDSSKRFLDMERLHASQLNAFTDTIDLSPDCEQRPFPPDPDPGVLLDSDESPVTEDLEPIPLFTQTITSDHEQSPLTEVKPFPGQDEEMHPFFHPIVEVKIIEPPDVSPTDSPEENPLYENISPTDSHLYENITEFVKTEEQGPIVIETVETEESPTDLLVVLDQDPELSLSDPVVVHDHEPELSLSDPVISLGQDPEPPLVVLDQDPELPVDPEPARGVVAAAADSVDASVVCVSVANSMLPEALVQEDEWTTVGDAVKEVTDAISCEATELFEPQPVAQHTSDIPPLPVPLPLHDSSVSESTMTTTTTTTKTVKKKKSAEAGDADASNTRVKKTKKTKKSEEKENHISVMTNGHHSPEAELRDSSGSVSPSSQWTVTSTPADDDELSNVCVRDLKQTYCREAAKATSTLKVASEEPVPSPVSIKQLKARSLGDLRLLTDSPPPRSIHTGVSVRALAASYWSLVSQEPTSPSLLLTPPPNKNVTHELRKSSFSKFDQLQKKTVLHVRSSDSSKIQKQLNQGTEGAETQGANPTCKACGKTVFVMEQVKAERSVWHKNCFRCKECSKQLTVDIYQSHEGELFCKPHFKQLFMPKVVLDNTEDEPPSDKADLGLEELSSLNVKSRFQIFEKVTENGSETNVERSASSVSVKRSPSILSKLAKFQKKGMDVGVTDEILNGADYEESSSSEDENQGEDNAVVKSSKKSEKPVSFNKMEDVMRTWESSSGTSKTKDELRAEHKKEISQIRCRLFQGKQGKMKEMYEQAVAESEGKTTNCKKDHDIVLSEKSRLIKERFERGEVIHSDEDEDEEKNKNKDSEDMDMSVFEAGISKKSRSLFLELDATAAKTQLAPVTPPASVHTHAHTTRKPPQVSRQASEDVVRESDHTEEVVVSTADISTKFKFFETYKAPEKERKAFRITPPREGQVKEGSPEQEIYRDPSVVRSEDQAEDESLVKRSQTASRMLSLFRQMEEQKETVPDGPKPLKCFTPPPDYKAEQSDSEEESEEEEEEASEDDGIIRASDKIEDEALMLAQSAARAKSLREKFEHWEPEKQSVNNAINLLDSEQESIESTKSLRARFESLKADTPKEKPAPKVNRFV